ncbi:hypothetical protein RJT34_06770 [Clitoria ternatea]|uniref:Uncharacterized protein n=1 Tax=Clitoria ternatea TaxID=43366 RepID=A0AAN9K220_CLITE
MGNANDQEDRAISGAFDPSAAKPFICVAHAPNSCPPIRAFSSDSMANSPSHNPCRSRSSILFGPQVKQVVKTGVNEAFGIACLNNPLMGQERWGTL